MPVLCDQKVAEEKTVAGKRCKSALLPSGAKARLFDSIKLRMPRQINYMGGQILGPSAKSRTLPCKAVEIRPGPWAILKDRAEESRGDSVPTSCKIDI